MKTILLAAGAAALALTAGSTLAAAKHKAAAVAEPKQPIPYTQLAAYLKASPKQRAHKDWWSGQTSVASNAAPVSTAGADTGAAANTSSTSTPSPSLPGDTPSAAPALPAAPPVNSPSSTEVNPPASPAPATPPK